MQKLTKPSPSLPSPSLIFCAILLILFGGKRLIWGDDLYSLHQMASLLCFYGMFHSLGYLWTASSFIPLSPFSLADKLDWCNTCGKWSLTKNPDRNWWHCHSSIKNFWLQPMAPWTTSIQKLYHYFDFSKKFQYNMYHFLCLVEFTVILIVFVIIVAELAEVLVWHNISDEAKFLKHATKNNELTVWRRIFI